jgi:hypothetical protein
MKSTLAAGVLALVGLASAWAAEPRIDVVVGVAGELLELGELGALPDIEEAHLRLEEALPEGAPEAGQDEVLARFLPLLQREDVVAELRALATIEGLASVQIRFAGRKPDAPERPEVREEAGAPRAAGLGTGLSRCPDPGDGPHRVVVLRPGERGRLSGRWGASARADLHHAFAHLRGVRAASEARGRWRLRDELLPPALALEEGWALYVSLRDHPAALRLATGAALPVVFWERVASSPGQVTYRQRPLEPGGLETTTTGPALVMLSAEVLLGRPAVERAYAAAARQPRASLRGFLGRILSGRAARSREELRDQVARIAHVAGDDPWLRDLVAPRPPSETSLADWLRAP